MSHDGQLQERVLAELTWEPSLTAGHIGVTAVDGVVTLTGHVENYAAKSAAETAARRVRGVRAVAEELEVRLPTESVRDDADIAAAALNRLDWDVSVPEGVVGVRVEGGWVTLTGAVDWRYQKDAAERGIRPLYGVSGVSNHISIKARVDTRHLRDQITHALQRSWYGAGDVRVSAEGGKVRLTGTVHTPHDREAAGWTAWAAPGTAEVENDIAVV